MSHWTERGPAEADYALWEWSGEVRGPATAHCVRIECREFLARHASPNSDLSSSELILAELIANVVRHASGIGTFHIDWRNRHPDLVVVDSGPGFAEIPRATLADPDAESGRGLSLVDALSMHVELGNRSSGGAFVRVTLPVERAS